MEQDSGLNLKDLKVDGGASANNYLMQFQSDILDLKVVRPEVIESTAQGAAYMAGIHIGMWKKEDIIRKCKISKTTLINHYQELYNGKKKLEEIYKQYKIDFPLKQSVRR